MGPASQTFARRARAAAAGALVGVALLAFPTQPAGAAPGCTPVMGRATITPAQMSGWFAQSGRQAKLDVSVFELAAMFVEEGAREGVRGDLAFAQSIVETGYFGFSPSVSPDTHNYAGIGATGGGVKGTAFPDARTGVRAQVQHLRAYADPSLRSAADLRQPLVDPRFGFLVPNERTVPCWEQFGNGVWAADPSGYGPRVLAVSQRIAAFPIPKAVAPAPPEPAAPPPTEPLATPTEPAAAVLEVPDAAVPPREEQQVVLDVAPVLADFVTLPTAASGGRAAAAASVLTGLALLSICATLWWHGRRFARAT